MSTVDVLVYSMVATKKPHFFISGLSTALFIAHWLIGMSQSQAPYLPISSFKEEQCVNWFYWTNWQIAIDSVSHAHGIGRF
jgi:hypothetical protein